MNMQIFRKNMDQVTLQAVMDILKVIRSNTGVGGGMHSKHLLVIFDNVVCRVMLEKRTTFP